MQSVVFMYISYLLLGFSFCFLYLHVRMLSSLDATEETGEKVKVIQQRHVLCKSVHLSK